MRRTTGRAVHIWTTTVMLLASTATAPVLGGHQAPPHDEALLYVPHTYVRVDRDGLTCGWSPFDTSGMIAIGRSVVWGPVDYLAHPEPVDDRIVVRGGGHTIELHDHSDVAVVDGRPVRLERRVDWFLRVRVPMNTLAPILGYTLVVDRSAKEPEAWWMVRLPKGRPVPPQIVTARRVLQEGPAGSWLLLYDRGRRLDGVCGHLLGLSGTPALMRPRGPREDSEGPWAEAQALVQEIPWQVAWDMRRGSGRVTYRGRSVTLRLRTVEGRPALAVGRTRYRAPERAAALLRQGRLAFPVGPVATALGWDYRQQLLYTPPISVLRPP